MSKDPVPNTKMLKLDPATHKQITEVAAWLGVEPGVLVSEAVVAYLHSSRDALVERVNERLEGLFAKLDDAAKPAKGNTWASSAPAGWNLRSEIWGETASDT